MNVKKYDWNKLTVSGIAPISLADVGIDISISQVYEYVREQLEQVLTMPKTQLRQALHAYTQNPE